MLQIRANILSIITMLANHGVYYMSSIHLTFSNPQAHLIAVKFYLRFHRFFIVIPHLSDNFKIMMHAYMSNS
jgi:hypothetical protein